MISQIKNNLFARNTFILFFGTLVANFLHYLFHLMLGRMVSVEKYGEIEALISLINIVTIPAATLSLVAIRYSAICQAEKDPKKNRLVLNYLNRKILNYGLPLLAIAFLFTPWIQEFLKIESVLSLFIVWLLMFLCFFSSINSGAVAGWQKFGGLNLIRLIDALFKLVTAFILVKIGYQVSGAIGGFMLGMVMAYIASFFILKFIYFERKSKGEKLDSVIISSVKKYLLPVFLGSVIINFLGNLDMIFAKHNLIPELAGQYGALNVMGKIIFLATGVIGTVLFSMSSAKNHQQKNSLDLLKKAIFVTLGLSAVAVAIYFLAPKLVIYFIFGAKYYGVAGYLGWFAVLAMLYSLVNLLVQYFLSVNKTRAIYGFLVILIVFVIILSFFGKSLYTILTITILAQVSGVAVGFGYLVREKNS